MKADGHEFERQFKKEVSKHNHVLRLPTLNTGFAGLTQPADFIVVGNFFNYVELKETAGDSFSISAMEQFDSMKQFVREKNALRTAGQAVATMQYWLVVHFIKYNLIKMITAEQALELASQRKTLRPSYWGGHSYKSLKEIGDF